MKTSIVVNLKSVFIKTDKLFSIITKVKVRPAFVGIIFLASSSLYFQGCNTKKNDTGVGASSGTTSKSDLKRETDKNDSLNPSSLHRDDDNGDMERNHEGMEHGGMGRNHEEMGHGKVK